MIFIHPSIHPSMIIHSFMMIIHPHLAMVLLFCFCSRRLHRREMIIALVVVLILSYYSNLLLLLTLLFWIFLGLLVLMMMVMVVVVVVLFLWFFFWVCSGCFVCPLGVFLFFFFFFFFECFPCGTIMLMVVPVWKACEKKAAYFPTIFLPCFRLGRLQFREYYRLLVLLVLYYSLARLQLDWLSTAATAAVSMAVQAQYPSNALLPSYRNRLPSPSLCLGFFLAMCFLFWLVGIGNLIEQCGLQVQNRERERDRENSAENCSVPRDPVLSLEVPEELWPVLLGLGEGEREWKVL